MNDKTQKMADRLKASELLARAAGVFVFNVDKDGYLPICGETDGESVVIYMPAREDDVSCNSRTLPP